MTEQNDLIEETPAVNTDNVPGIGVPVADKVLGEEGTFGGGELSLEPYAEDGGIVTGLWLVMAVQNEVQHLTADQAQDLVGQVPELDGLDEGPHFGDTYPNALLSLAEVRDLHNALGQFLAEHGDEDAPGAMPENEPMVFPDHPLLKFFGYAHLPPHLQPVSAPFAELADHIARLPAGAEQTVAMRKLLESKDCAVRTLV